MSYCSYLFWLMFERCREEKWNKLRVLIVHAGGMSQRMPNASALGKAFVTLPLDGARMSMLEAKLMSYVDLPEKIVEGGGVFVCSSDTIESYHDADIEWSFHPTGEHGSF